jgi:hypothetical protein
MPAKTRNEVEVDLVYPADATPPQVLTVLNDSQQNVLEAQGLPHSTGRALSQDF